LAYWDCFFYLLPYENVDLDHHEDPVSDDKDFPRANALHNLMITGATVLIYELGTSQEDGNPEGSVLAILEDSPKTILFIE
jgi:hypothetical protein